MPVIGFISAPAWADPSPYEFITVVKEKVMTQQTFPLLPDFDYSLDSIASELVAERFCLCARSLAAAGCDLIVQVGTPFGWAKMAGEQYAREFNARIERASGIPCILTTLSIIDALRAHQVSNIAICTYYSLSWKTQFSSFLTSCGFNVLDAVNFAEQHIVTNEAIDFGYDWHNATDIVKKSIKLIKNKRPEVEAIVVTGNGLRTLDVLCELESIAQCPVVSADIAIYWHSARFLNLTLSSNLGQFKDLNFKGYSTVSDKP